MKKIVLILVAVIVLMIGSSVFAIDENAATNEIELALKSKGLSTENKEKVILAFKAMLQKGIPSEEALSVVKAGIQNNYSVKEIESVTNRICSTVQEEGTAKEVAEIAKESLQSRIKEKDMERLMLAVKESLGKDASAKQLRIMVKDLCKNECDGDGLVAAIRAVGDLVENGSSPAEARKIIAVATMEALKNGFKGETLANKVQDRVRERTRTKEGTGEQLQIRERTEMPEEVKDRIKTPDVSKPADTGSEGTTDTKGKK